MKKKITSKIVVAALVMAMAATSLMGCGSEGVIEPAATEETSAEESQDEVQEDASAAQDSEEAVDNSDQDTSLEETLEAIDELDLDIDLEGIEDEISEAVSGAGESDEPLTAKAFVDNMVIGWNLGNTFDAFNGKAGQLRNDGLSTETCWGNPKTTKEIMDAVKGCGFNVIRIPVTWYNHMDPNTYEIDSEWLDRVHEVVDFTLDDNTYVIINSHHDTGTDGWLHASNNNIDQKKAIFQAMWTQVATSFADYDDNLLFEGFNEILDDNNDWSNPSFESLDVVNELNQLFVDTVRSTGKGNANRVLLVNTYCAGTNKSMLNRFEIPTDTVEGALCAEVHAYCPYYYTATEAPDVTTWSENDVKSVFQATKLAFQLKKTPVIIGEFGVVDKNNLDNRLEYFDYYVSTAKENGLKCIIWDNGITKEFGYMDRKKLCAARAEEVETIVSAANR